MGKGEIVQQPRSRFIRVKCLDCENEQIIFASATTDVTCLKCGKILAKPSGGKANLEPIAREIEVLSSGGIAWWSSNVQNGQHQMSM